MSKKSTDSGNFEQALATLDKIVHQLEQGQLSLDQSLAQFEQGVQLIRQCQATLTEATQKVQILTQGSEGHEPKPFDNDTER